MEHNIDGIDISSLLKARDRFESFYKNLNTDQEKLGAIQAFDCSYEQAWKTMKRVLGKRGIDARSPRDCFRQAALNNLIKNPENWFIFIEKRNLSSHTYKEENIDNILKIFSVFYEELVVHNKSFNSYF